jgi:insertion element IS1 protein InsB
LFEFEVGDGSKSTYLKLALRVEEVYKIKHLCTDGNKTYRYYKISEQHHQTKSETCLVESWNCRLRHYLVRLHRKTLCYSKSLKALTTAVLLLIHKEIALSIFI